MNQNLARLSLIERFSVYLLMSTALAACHREQASMRGGAPKSSSKVASQAVSGANASSTPAPTASAVAEAPRAPGWWTPPAPPNSSGFWIVAEGKCSTLRAQPVEGAVIVTNGSGAGSPGGPGDADAFVATLGADGRLEVDPKLQFGRGDRPVVCNVAMSGRWPDRLFSRCCTADSATFGCTRYWYDGASWQHIRHSEQLDKFAGEFYEWSEGRILASGAVAYEGPAFFVLDGKTLASRPGPEDPAPRISSFDRAARAFPSGEILSWAAPSYCDSDGPRESRFSVYEPSTRRWRHHRLPNTCGASLLVAHEPRKAWMMSLEEVAAGVVFSLVHYNGNELVREKTPLRAAASGDLRALGVDSAGTVWAVVTDTLWTRPSGGTWEKVELPQPLFGRAEKSVRVHATNVVVLPPDDVWVAATYADVRPEGKNFVKRGLLLRRRPPKEVEFCDMRAPLVEAIAPFPPPSTLDCTSPLAVLARVTKTATAEKHSKALTPVLKATVPDAALSLLELGPTRFIVARVADHATGKKLIATVAQRVPGSTPELVCYRPGSELRALTDARGTPAADR